MNTSRRAFLLQSLAIASLGYSLPAFAQQKTNSKISKTTPAPIPTLPLSIAIALENNEPVRNNDWIDAQIAEAEALFSLCGLHFKKAQSRTIDSRYARLETRKDRDALKDEMLKGHINVMVVNSLRDVDDPSLFRMGVHWRPQSDLKKHYVIVAASAMPTTLAHELGHFFGNGHSGVKNNVMSYDRDGGKVFFDAVQQTKIKNFARIYLQSKEITP